MSNTHAHIDHHAHLVVKSSTFQYAIRVGVLQGSQISLVFFIAFTYGLLDVLESIVYIQAIAEDILSWDDSSSRGPSPSHIQQNLDIIHRWSEHWGLNFNASKCKALEISRQRGLDLLSLHIVGALVPQV